MLKRKELLQLFNDEQADQNDEKNAEENEKPNENESGKPLKYTDEDLDRIINIKFAKWEKAKAEELSEAEKLAQMTAEERLNHEKDGLQKQIDELIAEKTRNTLSAQARNILRDEKINAPDEIINVLIGKDAEETKTNIEAFKSMFNETVENAVKEALKGNTPKSTSNNSPLTRESIEAIKDRAERQRLIAENEHLFK